MLKDKEVVADPQRQYEIARQVHAGQHGGINKTTAAIAEHYHWVRIKETVSLAIKNCPECKDATAKIPTVRPTGDGLSPSPSAMDGTPQQRRIGQNVAANHDPNALIERLVNFDDLDSVPQHHSSQQVLSQQTSQQNLAPAAVPGQLYSPPNHTGPVANMANYQSFHSHLQDQIQHELQGYNADHDAASHIPLDPQIMSHHPPQQHDHQQQDQYHRQEHHLDGYQASHGAEDGQYELDMNDLGGTSGNDHHHPQRDDTRLATLRHVTQHDEPEMYVHQGHEGEKEDDIFMQ